MPCEGEGKDADGQRRGGCRERAGGDERRAALQQGLPAGIKRGSGGEYVIDKEQPDGLSSAGKEGSEGFGPGLKCVRDVGKPISGGEGCLRESCFAAAQDVSAARDAAPAGNFAGNDFSLVETAGKSPPPMQRHH